MTALERYDRLEAVGQWREGPDADPREVIVSFGATTLVLRDLAERAVGHWALAGMQVYQQSSDATIYSTAPDGHETLRIYDPLMVAAISEVSRMRDAPPPSQNGPDKPAWRLHPGSVQALALVALSVMLGPVLLRDQALRMVPPGQASEFGDRMLLGLMDRHGTLCERPAGRQALERIAAQVPDAAGRPVRVLDLGDTPVAWLPGGALLLDRSIITRADTPEDIAGWIALAAAHGSAQTALAGLMRAIGPRANLRYVLTGKISDARLARAASGFLPPPDTATIAAAIASLARSGINPAPFAESLRGAGLMPDTVPPQFETPRETLLLANRDWLALKEICG
jgi:hypothetical protein